MTHAEFEYHFAKEAEKFGIAEFIRENKKDYDFQSFMLALSGIVARNEPVDEDKLDDLANQYAKTTYLEEGVGGWEDGAEAYRAGYRKAKQE